MKIAKSLASIFVCALFLPVADAQQAKPMAASPSATTTSPIQRNIEAYLRHVYALGADVQVTVGAPKETPIEGLLETDIDVTIAGDKQTAKFYISKDGKYLLRSDLADTSKDPLAEIRKQIDLAGAPILGDSRAPVTLVEYSDFECPVCRSLHDVLRGLLPNYAGKVRVVFKDFPLDQLHPWARTAAIAGRCAYQQEPSAFWKIYDLIYDSQELISAANAWTKMVDFAGKAGVNTDSFKSCMASSEPASNIDASIANGQRLDVSSTPTIFINGRRIIGADSRLIEQYINYELAQVKQPKTTEKK